MFQEDIKSDCNIVNRRSVVFGAGRLHRRFCQILSATQDSPGEKSCQAIDGLSTLIFRQPENQNTLKNDSFRF